MNFSVSMAHPTIRTVLLVENHLIRRNSPNYLGHLTVVFDLDNLESARETHCDELVLESNLANKQPKTAIPSDFDVLER